MLYASDRLEAHKKMVTLSRLSWKWRKRSSVKITERTYEEGTYRWQKEPFENGAAAFQSQERPQRQVEEKQTSRS
jgi:hypothetical protein